MTLSELVVTSEETELVHGCGTTCVHTVLPTQKHGRAWGADTPKLAHVSYGSCRTTIHVFEFNNCDLKMLV